MLLHGHARGFTIIELMTVLLIAGVLLVIAAPAFTDMLERRRVEGQANEFVTDLSYAKSEAVQRNRNIEVLAGGGGTCYTIAAMTTGTSPAGGCDCTAAPGSRCTSADTAELKTVTLTGGVTLTNGSRFVFEPVRGGLAPIPPAAVPAAASAVVSVGSRSYTVSVTAYGRITPFTP